MPFISEFSFISFLIYAFYLFLLFFLVTSCLVVPAQPCMEWMSIGKNYVRSPKFELSAFFKNFWTPISPVPNNSPLPLIIFLNFLTPPSFSFYRYLLLPPPPHPIIWNWRVAGIVHIYQNLNHHIILQIFKATESVHLQLAMTFWHDQTFWHSYWHFDSCKSWAPPMT